MKGRKPYDPRNNPQMRLMEVFKVKTGNYPDETELREFVEKRKEDDRRSRLYWSKNSPYRSKK